MIKGLRSFTLIELMIAATIFAIVMVSVFSSFRSGVLSVRTVDSNTELFQTGRVTLEQLNADLRNSFAYKANFTGFLGTAQELTFFTVVDNYVNGQIMPELSRVSYASVENNGQSKIVRSSLLGLAALENDSSGYPESLAENAQLYLRYGYLVNGSEAEGLQFKDSWASKDTEESERAKLPQAVEATVIFNITVEKEKRFQRTIYLPLAKQ